MALYHYTSKQNLAEIRRSGFIMASRHFGGPHGRDALLGEGVYLSDIPPNASTDEILKNNYGTAAGRVYQQDPNVADAYIKIPRQYINAQCEVMPGGRKVYVVPTGHGVNLNNIPYEVGYRN